VDEIDWSFDGHSFTKIGRGQAKIFATLRAQNNTNPPFQNPGSTTGMSYNFSQDCDKTTTTANIL